METTVFLSEWSWFQSAAPGSEDRWQSAPLARLCVNRIKHCFFRETHFHQHQKPERSMQVLVKQEELLRFDHNAPFPPDSGVGKMIPRLPQSLLENREIAH